MNDLCADIGYKSVNHFGEQLCGDLVDIVEPGENPTVVARADGVGGGGVGRRLSVAVTESKETDDENSVAGFDAAKIGVFIVQMELVVFLENFEQFRIRTVGIFGFQKVFVFFGEIRVRFPDGVSCCLLCRHADFISFLVVIAING